MSAQVLFEEDGAFKVGSVREEAGASLQVEAVSGKRSKVKAANVLLRFASEPLSTFMADAQRLADEIDPDFLWQVSGGTEIAFDALAKEYFGHVPAPREAAAVALRLHASPMYFYKRGKGRYQGAPEENLKAALAGIERKRRQQEQVDAWAAEVLAGRLPEPIAAKLDPLLFKPDKMALEWRALDAAATSSGLAIPKLLARGGILASPEEWFLRRFAFERFPGGFAHREAVALDRHPELPLAAQPAFSIDDEETTEIDDAFSLAFVDAETVRVGIHIAAPSLYFAPGNPVEQVARERLSTVYFPGGKVTMLPEAAIAAATLGAGQEVPCASLYLDIDAATLAVRASESRVERVTIADNLRLSDLDSRMDNAAVESGAIAGAHGRELHFLWRLAGKLREARGARPDAPDRLDYTFRVVGGRVAIVPRRRGSPVDMLVAELMIHVNATWGKLLAANGLAAIYRNQQAARTRMETAPDIHEGLGVTHYAWSSSPLRRYVDLANQRQLVALLTGGAPAFDAAVLAAAARDFEDAYEAYNEFQRHMERYWCLRWLVQEGRTEAIASVIRDDLVRIDGLPLVLRALGMPVSASGDKVRVAFGESDFWEVSVLCRYAGPAA
jgi:exoribonuclease-2